MNRNSVCFHYSLPIGAAKLIPVNRCFPAVCYQVEQEDNGRINAGICRQVVFISELQVIFFPLYLCMHYDEFLDMIPMTSMAVLYLLCRIRYLLQ